MNRLSTDRLNCRLPVINPGVNASAATIYVSGICFGASHKALPLLLRLLGLIGLNFPLRAFTDMKSWVIDRLFTLQTRSYMNSLPRQHDDAKSFMHKSTSFPIE